MAYELWETLSGNLVGTYPTQQAALDALRRFPERATFALGYEGDDGETELIAAGADLEVLVTEAGKG